MFQAAESENQRGPSTLKNRIQCSRWAETIGHYEKRHREAEDYDNGFVGNYHEDLNMVLMVSWVFYQNTLARVY